MTLGDRIAVMRAGVLQQVDTPKELYDHPLNLFVAGFMGSPAMNFFPARVEGDHLKLLVRRPPAAGDACARRPRAPAGPDRRCRCVFVHRIAPTVDDRAVTAPAEGGVDAIARLAEALAEEDIVIEDLGLRQPTLDDAFLTLTASSRAGGRGGGRMSAARPSPWTPG